MAHEKVSITLTILILVPLLSWSGVLAQPNDCTKVIISMSPCLNYITGNSSAPSVACCTQLDTVVRTQPQCLCQVLNGGGSNMGLNINQTQALELPKACTVQTPPASRCNAASPSGSPTTPNSTNPSSAASPSGSPTTPNSTNPSSGGVSRTMPSAGDGSSDAVSMKLSVPMMFLAVFVVSYVSTFSMS